MDKRKRKKKQQPGKLFKRSREQWAASLNDHIGKFIDRITLRDLAELGPLIVCAIAGARTVPDTLVIDGVEVPAPIEAKIAGASFGMIGYKLATSDNTVSGAAGVSALAGIGLANMVDAGMVNQLLVNYVEAAKGIISTLTSQAIRKDVSSAHIL